MKITLAKDNKYRIETTVKIPDDSKNAYGIIETGFSPNPYDPVISYEMERENTAFKLIVDKILDAEHRLS